MNRTLLVAALATVLIVATVASASSSSSSSSSPAPPATCGAGAVSNPFPVNDAAPTFVAAVKNGKRFAAGKGTDNFTVLHLYGTSYEMGVAQGQLMKKEMQMILPEFTKYVESMINSTVPWLPSWMDDIVAKYGLDFLLDLNIEWTKQFTPQHFMDELRGLADGSGLTMKEIWRLNLFPSLIKAACTIALSHNGATPNGGIHHLRALDIGPGIPIKNFAQLTIYHFDAATNGANKYPVANFGWTMLIGSLTGINSERLGAGEKVWEGRGLPKTPSGGSIASYKGTPWDFLFRDILAQTDTATAALAKLEDSNRTCSIHYGYGSSKTNEIRLVESAAKYFKTFTDTLAYHNHPALQDIVYWDKHTQGGTDVEPSVHGSNNMCLPDLLKNFYGNVTAYNYAKHIAAQSGTGDFQAVSWDYENLVAYYANSRKTYVTEGNVNAYMRQYTKVDLKALFDVKQ